MPAVSLHPDSKGKPDTAARHCSQRPEAADATPQAIYSELGCIPAKRGVPMA